MLRVPAGATARIDADSHDLLVTRDGVRLFTLPAATVADAAHIPGPAPEYELTRTGDRTFELSLRISRAWLGDPARAYPVTVDPTTSSTNNLVASECALEAPQPYMGYAGFTVCDSLNTSEVAIGRSDPGGRGSDTIMARFRAMLRFQLTGYLGTDEAISSAKVHVYKTGSVGSPGTIGFGAMATSAAWPDVDTAMTAIGGSGYSRAGGSASTGWLDADLTRVAGLWQINRKSATRGMENDGLVVSATSDWVDCDGFAGDDAPQTMCDDAIWWLASNTYADTTKRPYLEVVSWPAAPGGSKILHPTEGELTARRVTLQAEAFNSTVTTARFQYSVDGDDWADIPLSSMRYASSHGATGTTVTNANVPVSSLRTDPIFWDLQALPGGVADGSVHVRAILEDPTEVGGGVVPVVNFRLDRSNPEGAASAPMGPGEMNLLTGDFTVAATDASSDAWLASLGVSRTYHSRGVSTRNTELFGPSWTAGFDGDGGDLPYKGMYNYSEVKEEQVTNWIQAPVEHQFEVEPDYFEDEFGDVYELAHDPVSFVQDEWQPVTDTLRWEYHYMVIDLQDGGKITFTQQIDPSGTVGGWEPDAAHPGLSIAQSGATWVLSSTDGTKTTFAADAAGSPKYHPTRFEEPGSTQALTFSWDTLANGRKRLAKINAPRLSASIANPERQDRFLRFEWGNVPVTGGGTQPRVVKIWLGRWSPAASAMAETEVSRYEYDATGRLKKVTDPRSGLATQYAYDAQGRLVTLTPPGEAAWTMAYTTIAGDPNPGRLATVTRAHPTLGNATWTARYDVPTSGAGAPYDLSPATTATWGEVDDLPTDGVAIFPPDAVPGTSPNYARATVHYLDVHGREVNVGRPGGGITTTGYDGNGNVQLELSAKNRATALAGGGDTAAAAYKLMTLHRFGTNGVDEVEVLTPYHSMQLKDGTTVEARRSTLTSFDHGPDPAVDYHLPTAVRVGARLLDGTIRDAELTEYGYDDLAGTHRGWSVRKATKTVQDSGGTGHANLTSWTTYDANYPLVRETRTPSAGSGATSPNGHITKYYYFGLDTAQTGCATGGDGLTGLLCRTTTSVQTPAAALPAHTYKYDLDWNPTEEREEVNTTVRVKTTTYDAAGRPSTMAVTGPGATVPTRTYAYDAASGHQTTVTTPAAGAEPARTITQAYDSNGRMSSYTDGDGKTTTFAYDLDGRRTTLADAKGTRTTTYGNDDAVATVADTALGGTVTVGHDLDGNLTHQSLPNGLSVDETYDNAGQESAKTYTKTTGCTANCVSASTTVARDMAGRIVSEIHPNRTRHVEYDGSGRISADEDQPTGAACRTHVYVYDSEGNRSTRRTYGGGTGGVCQRSTVSDIQTLSYDSADRLVGGPVTDGLGRVTSVSGAIGGGSGVTSTYAADDQVATLSDGTTTQTYGLDPDRRMRSRVTTSGTTSTTEISHYAESGDQPSWTETGTSWTRWIPGLDSETLATVDQAGAVTYLLTDLQGTVLARASGSTVTAAGSYDVFGAPTTGTTSDRHGWLGARQRSTELSSGAVRMGVRTYLPNLGRFLAVDPVAGGSANPYDYVFQDPVNKLDLSGQATAGGRCIEGRKGFDRKKCEAAGFKITKPQKFKNDRYDMYCRVSELVSYISGVGGVFRAVAKHWGKEVVIKFDKKWLAKAGVPIVGDTINLALCLN